MRESSGTSSVRFYLWWRWQQIVCAVRGHIWLIHGDGEGMEWNCCERCGWNDEPWDDAYWDDVRKVARTFGP